LKLGLQDAGAVLHVPHDVHIQQLLVLFQEYQFWNLITRDLGISFSTLRIATLISGHGLRTS
jgi:hypothetical protein